MGVLKEVRKLLGFISKGLGWAFPVKIRAMLQALVIGLDAFILAYKTVRELQENKVKKQIEETAEKIKDPRLTLEERLKLNAEMESHYKHFVGKSGVE